jgi:hypothetical protein
MINKFGIIFFFGIIFSLSITSYPQFKQTDEITLTGNLKMDSKILLSNSKLEEKPLNFVQEDNKNKKNPVLAGLFSLILPGAGEFYTGDYWKTGIFIAIEAAVITTAIVYNNKGNNETNFFQNYANVHWSDLRYAKWTLDHLQNLNSALTMTADSSGYKNTTNGNVYTVIGNGNIVDLANLNQLESDIGDGYSHQLPPQGLQQYYELIGKYPQYSHGWDQSNFNDNDFHILTSQFIYYAGLRGMANNYYNVAAKAIIVIYINHVLSTIDAVWSAISYNNNLQVSVRVNQQYVADKIEFVPTLTMKLNF